MSIKEFSTDWAPAISAIAAMLSLLSLLLLWYQIRGTNVWNKVAAAFGLMDLDRFYLLEEQATKDCKAISVPFPAPLSLDQARQVRNNYNAYHAVKNLAIFLDRIAVAYQSGYADKEVVAATFGPILVGYKRVLESYIQLARTELKSPEAYRDFSRTADDCQEWLNKRRLKISSELDGDQAGGISPKV